jgi:hypothetical protein
LVTISSGGQIAGMASSEYNALSLVGLWNSDHGNAIKIQAKIFNCIDLFIDGVF